MAELLETPEGIDEAAPPSPPEDSQPFDEEDAQPEPEGSDEGEEADDVVAPEVDVEDIIESKVEPVQRTLMDSKGRSFTYTQKSLTYFGKIQLYGLLARAVKILMEGEDGLGLGEVMDLADPRSLADKILGSLPGAEEAPDAEERKPEMDADDAAKMMAAFAKVVSVAPELLTEFYCIVLTPQKGHWKWLTDWGLPEMDDETGVDVLHTFVDQNWTAMEDFFVREMPKLFRRAARARQLHKSAGAR